jgi:hypothetical protein
LRDPELTVSHFAFSNLHFSFYIISPPQFDLLPAARPAIVASMLRRCLAAAVMLFLLRPAAAQDVAFQLDELTRLPPVDSPVETLPPPTAAIAPEEWNGKFVDLEPGWQVWSPEFWDPWEGSVELGLSGTEGNSQTFNVRFGLTAKHKTDFLHQTLQITSIQKSADGITTANTALLDGRLDWPMPASRWNYYLHGLVEYDQFKAFDYRFSGDTGFGYEFIQTARTTLIGRSGISTSVEVGGPDNRLNPELIFGGEFKHKFNPTHAIGGKVDYFPNVTDWRDFRLNSQASWEIALSQVWGLSLKLSVIDRYDSTPHGARPNDLDYSTLLLWQF